MNFMCEKHRDKLTEDPKAATVLWCRLMFLARHQAKAQAWQKSIISYGNALDAAHVIFENDPASPEVSRYIRTASELAYAIRKCNYPCDIQLVIAEVKHNLKKSLYPANVQLLLIPLTDIAYSPLQEVHQWMKEVFEADIDSQSYNHH
ncbi:MAG: hypothetical protein ACI9T9_001301 [Oleiphilaceae bacterium]|jgi:hypothetical protein